MIKALDSCWVPNDRSTAWMKIKVGAGCWRAIPMLAAASLPINEQSKASFTQTHHPIAPPYLPPSQPEYLTSLELDCAIVGAWLGEGLRSGQYSQARTRGAQTGAQARPPPPMLRVDPLCSARSVASTPPNHYHSRAQSCTSLLLPPSPTTAVPASPARAAARRVQPVSRRGHQGPAAGSSQWADGAPAAPRACQPRRPGRRAEAMPMRASPVQLTLATLPCACLRFRVPVCAQLRVLLPRGLWPVGCRPEGARGTRLPGQRRGVGALLWAWPQLAACNWGVHLALRLHLAPPPEHQRTAHHAAPTPPTPPLPDPQ